MEPEVTSNENVTPGPTQFEGGKRDVNQSENLDSSTGRTATDTAGEKPETNAAEPDAPNAPEKTQDAPPAYEAKPLAPHDLAGREMAVIAPANDDGSRAAYVEMKKEAAKNDSSSSPKMGDDGANSTND